MKWFHNANMAKWFAFVFALLIEVLLGVNAFFLVNVSTEIIFTEFPILALLVSALFGIGLFLGGMWVFMFAEYSYKACRAYTIAHNTWPWREVIVYLLIVGVIGLDLTSLAFRRAYLNNRGADWLFWFFVILALLPPLIGVLVHVFVNKPVEYRYGEAYDSIHQQTIDELVDVMPGMPLDKKLRYLNGDPDALREHLEAHTTRTNRVKEIRENERIEAAEAKHREREEAARKASPMQQLIGGFKRPFVGSQTNQDQADRLSQSNGRK